MKRSTIKRGPRTKRLAQAHEFEKMMRGFGGRNWRETSAKVNAEIDKILWKQNARQVATIEASLHPTDNQAIPLGDADPFWRFMNRL